MVKAFEVNCEHFLSFIDSNTFLSNPIFLVDSKVNRDKKEKLLCVPP